MLRRYLKNATCLFLGCGSSTGVPVLGCSCRVCKSADPKNRRLRSSLFITLPNATLLIDAGPDFREQALRHNLIHPPSALLITHPHYDHIAGLEELRIYNFISGKPVLCYLSEESMQALEKIYYYHFIPTTESKNHTANFDFSILEQKEGSFSIQGHQIGYTTYFQGTMSVLGYRFGSLAYITDIKQFDESIFKFLQGVDTLIISAIRHGASRMQLSIDEAIDFSKKVKPSKTILMHMSHELEYEGLLSLLPKDVEPAYDGMQISFSI